MRIVWRPGISLMVLPLIPKPVNRFSAIVGKIFRLVPSPRASSSDRRHHRSRPDQPRQTIGKRSGSRGLTQRRATKRQAIRIQLSRPRRDTSKYENFLQARRCSSVEASRQTPHPSAACSAYPRPAPQRRGEGGEGSEGRGGGVESEAPPRSKSLFIVNQHALRASLKNASYCVVGDAGSLVADDLLASGNARASTPVHGAARGRPAASPRLA